MHTAKWLRTALWVLALATVGCGSNDSAPGMDPGDQPGSGPGSKPGEKPGETPGKTPEGTNPKPVEGATDFVSADLQNGQPGGTRAGLSGAAGAAATAPAAEMTADASFGNGAQRTVERGDVYRVLDDGRLLNLNAYRGLQVIDIRDLSAPKVEGRLAAVGTPVEMYVAGDRALVLLNDWQGYYGSRDDVKVESVNGGLVMNVDISDRAHPQLLAQATVPGYIRTSRLTQGNGQAALYVAADVYQNEPPYQNHTVVKSFDVSDAAISAKNELDLGGYVQDIQATPDVLLVASQDWNDNGNRSLVTIVDIANPDGTMVKGDTITAQGLVSNKFNMDVRGDVLRIVSGVSWNGSNDNTLETFDIRDRANAVPVDQCGFSDGQQLYATIFLEDRAFFVTYFRRDPFHAFSIDAQGHCAEHAEFVVSGWNDFLRPTLGDSRLIGIGHNDEANTSTVSVSLYDTTNIDNPNPLLARSDIDLTYSYSQAQWDDRAFTVLEDAVAVKAADGSSETGLVLLPYEGWDQNGQRYLAQVQIYTFSDHTLTKRGVMDHGSSVNRSFLTEPEVAGNLSDEQLSLFDTGDPDAPKELGRVDVAPSYRQLFYFGDYVARVKDRSYYFAWNGQQSVEPPKSQVEIMRRADDLDVGTPVASFEVPSGADLIQAGDLLVSVYTQTEYDQTGASQPKYHSSVQVFDLSDPADPQARGSLKTDRIEPSYGYYGPVGVAVDCFDCGIGGYWGGSHGLRYVVGEAIAFAKQTSQQRSLGMVHTCYQSPPYAACATSSDGTTTCPETQYVGSITCRTPLGGSESCQGTILKCNSTTGDCVEVDPPSGTQSSCYDAEEFRYWTSYAFDALDLRDPDAPSLAPRVELADDEEGSSLLADGSKLYFNFQQPYEVAGDPRAHVKRYFRLIDFSDPQDAQVGSKVNVPGDVIASDGSTIYTRDLVWGDTDTHTLVARLEVSSGLAHLQASRVFEDRAVAAVQLDGAGSMLVSSDPAWSYYRYYGAGEQPKHTLSILDAATLATVGETEVDSWATFQQAKAGRALFSVSGGLLLFDVEDPSNPKAQAYFPTSGWPDNILFDGDEIAFAAGPYGIYRFDANVFNLLSK